MEGLAMPTATKPTARKVIKATRPKPPPVEEIDDDEELDDTEDTELEELGEDEVEEIEEEAPKKKATAKKKAAANVPAFGTAQLAAHVSEQTGKTYDAKSMRILLRKLAPQLGRTVGETHERYSFSGPDDLMVKKIIKLVKGGALEKEKKEALDKLKASQAGKKAAKAKKVEEVEEVEELEEDDEDEE